MIGLTLHRNSGIMKYTRENYAALFHFCVISIMTRYYSVWGLDISLFILYGLEWCTFHHKLVCLISWYYSWLNNRNLDCRIAPFLGARSRSLPLSFFLTYAHMYEHTHVHANTYTHARVTVLELNLHFELKIWFTVCMVCIIHMYIVKKHRGQSFDALCYQYFGTVLIK